MFCTACGRRLVSGDRFCAYCGTAARVLESEQEVARSASPAAEVPVPEPPAPRRAAQSTHELFQNTPPQNNFAAARPAVAPEPQASAGWAEVAPADLSLTERQRPEPLRAEPPRIEPPARAASPVRAIPYPAPQIEPPAPPPRRLFAPESEPPRQAYRPPPPAQAEATPEVPLEGWTCPVCEKEIASDATFCQHCGTRFDVPQPAAQAVSPAPPKLGKTPRPAPEPVFSLTGSSVGEEGYLYEDEPKRSPLHRHALTIGIIVVLVAAIAAMIWIMRSNGSAASPVSVTIFPASATVVVGHGFNFAASVDGSDNADVTWKVEEGDAGGSVIPRGAQSSGGKVSMLGVYAAPNTPGTYHVVATSKADPQKSATADVTVTAK